MAEAKDPAIKLFGKTIPFPDASEEEGEEEEPSKDCKKEDEEEEDEEEATPEEQSKVLKKPDKILPCPRCNSMETKFCYYNNYNVNQPRHFCKNCQRYWTAGGTMRNVPVGAGRRKNKAHFRQIAVPETLAHPETPKPNGTVLTFGSDVPLHESMASALTLRPEPETEVGLSQENPAVSQNPPFLPRVPWSYPMMPPGFYPVPVFPCWGYTMPSPFPLPWLPSPTSGPSSPTLGKHSRDENAQKTSDLQKDSGAEKCLWIPKTLRIDDPEEAAKSSIWTTLGIRPDKPDLNGGRAIFKTFKSKGGENSHIAETSPVLQANPAALSRSVNFHESS